VKLIGSKAEREFREQLIRSNKFLNSENERLSLELRKVGFDLSNSFVLNHIPEQCEDIFVLLTSGSYVITIEIDKSDSENPVIIERVELKDYLKGLSKINQIQIAVAMDLMRT
jgi:hypothetical protein